MRILGFSLSFKIQLYEHFTVKCAIYAVENAIINVFGPFIDKTIMSNQNHKESTKIYFNYAS